MESKSLYIPTPIIGCAYLPFKSPNPTPSPPSVPKPLQTLLLPPHRRLVEASDLLLFSLLLSSPYPADDCGTNLLS